MHTNKTEAISLLLVPVFVSILQSLF
jgi:hypothetical protein